MAPPKNVLLGVTGSVAATKTPELVARLASDGHEVMVAATANAQYFFDRDGAGAPVLTDADEWPGDRYERGQDIPHIELRKWADALVIAPLDANTLAKLAVGLCDNLLTSVWRAWDFSRPVVLAPAMNTLMWRHPFTRRHLRAIAGDFGALHLPGHLGELDLIAQLNARAKGLVVVPPVEKELACGDVGVGAMADVAAIAAALDRLTTRPAPPPGSAPPSPPPPH